MLFNGELVGGTAILCARRDRADDHHEYVWMDSGHRIASGACFGVTCDGAHVTPDSGCRYRARNNACRELLRRLTPTVAMVQTTQARKRNHGSDRCRLRLD